MALVETLLAIIIVELALIVTLLWSNSTTSSYLTARQRRWKHRAKVGHIAVVTILVAIVALHGLYVS